MKGVGWMKKNISDDVEKIQEAIEEMLDFSEEESDLSSDESGEDIEDPKINSEEIE